MTSKPHDPAIYPLTFDPIFKDYLWGGRNLADKLGRRLPEGIVAESWDIAAHPDGSSRVNAGALAGLTLAEAYELLGVSLVGTHNKMLLGMGRFPLLIKLLDANRWLSLQVHPDDKYALAYGDDLGKTEMWVVLYAEPDAELIYGFKSGVTKAIFAQALADGTVEEWLHRLSIKAGDVIFVPAGAIHALGPGAIVAEIQQNSNTTFRIYDWGRDRPMHIGPALDVLNFDLIEPSTVEPEPISANGVRRERIGASPYFTTERLTMAAGSVFRAVCRGTTFEIWGVLDGKATVSWSGDPVTVTGVDWVLLPAVLGDYQVTAQEDSVLLRVLTV